MMFRPHDVAAVAAGIIDADTFTPLFRRLMPRFAVTLWRAMLR